MIKEFADYLSLNVWDWIAFLVALISLCVAICSFFIAKRTLKSQRQTEKNTMPIINLDTQKVLLNKLIAETFWSRINHIALWCLLMGKYSKTNTPKTILKEMELNLDLIHPELFYSQPDNYVQIMDLIKSIKEYNMNLGVLNDYLNDGNADEKMLEKLFSSLKYIVEAVILKWMTSMGMIFKMKGEDMQSWLLSEMKEKEEFEKTWEIVKKIKAKQNPDYGKSDYEKYTLSDKDLELLDPAGMFKFFCLGDEDFERKMLDFMSKQISMAMSKYAFYLGE